MNPVRSLARAKGASPVDLGGATLYGMKTVKQQIKELLEQASGIADFDVSIPPDSKLGDYSTNLPFLIAKKEGISPVVVAHDLAQKLLVNEKIQKVGWQVNDEKGFINFSLSKEFLQEQLGEISQDENYGKNDSQKGKTIMIEYTDPNPFKLFHIGHLMSNAIGESVARLQEAAGAKVLRVNYQGDVGLHIAKAVYGMKWRFWEVNRGLEYIKTAPIAEKIDFLGQAYSFGAGAYEAEPEAKKWIEDVNEKIYNKSDKEINELYDLGRKWSLEYFEKIYKKLGTKFDHYYFESEIANDGIEIIKSHPDIFVESDGATVFKGEEYGLHTRVFINSKGLPTYEAKELGLNKKKFEEYHPDLSLIVTGNEIREYFKVLLKAMELTTPEVAVKTKHVPHGMLRLPSGKMSSRTGDVITAESLIDQTKEKVKEKEKEANPDDEREKIAIGAIKYSILKQGIGQDIIFDFDHSLSLHGDSGPYLQYTYARLKNILVKAGEYEQGDLELIIEPSEMALVKLLLQFPDVVQEAGSMIAPNHLSLYLLQLATTANTFYEKIYILDDENISRRDARLTLVATVARTLKEGLGLLGIQTLDRI